MDVERAFLFVDGSNFYHALHDIGISTSELDYQALAHKLILDRELVGVRYYVGEVREDIPRIAAQRRFLAGLRAQGIEVTLGRIERRKLQPNRNRLIARLQHLIDGNRAALNEAILGELEALCTTSLLYFVEKRVDVSIAVDMVTMAINQEYDVAYLLSADGDYVPAVDAVRSRNMKVFAAFPAKGHELEKAVNSFIPLKREWFRGLLT